MKKKYRCPSCHAPAPKKHVFILTCDYCGRKFTRDDESEIKEPKHDKS